MSFVYRTFARCEPLQLNEDFLKQRFEPRGEGGGASSPPPHFLGTDGHKIGTEFFVGLAPVQLKADPWVAHPLPSQSPV